MRLLRHHCRRSEPDRAVPDGWADGAGPVVDRGAVADHPVAADDRGMSTAEYAVGTVAACGFAGLLFKVLTGDSVSRMLRDLVERALTTSF